MCFYFILFTEHTFLSSIRDGPIGPMADISSERGLEEEEEEEVEARKDLRSAPAQKVPPSPHNTPTFASSSLSKSSNALAVKKE